MLLNVVKVTIASYWCESMTGRPFSKLYENQSLVTVHNPLGFGSHRNIFGDVRKSSEHFGNVRKSSETLTLQITSLSNEKRPK